MKTRRSLRRSLRQTGAFTVVELLVVVSITALLVGILLPAIGNAREQAKLTISLANLRNLATAHQSYAAGWGDRQYTAVVDNITAYGYGAYVSFVRYGESNGSTLEINDARNHPPTYLGWGHIETGGYRMFKFECDRERCSRGVGTLVIPINFQGRNEFFGAFRIPNALNFSNYVSGRFYDPVFYAPKDTAVVDSVGQCFESPDQYCVHADVDTGLAENPAWSSYCTSPAGMLSPAVLAHDDPDDNTFNGFADPWDLPAGFRSPAFSQALYPALKTHVLEHHWLQSSAADCNANILGGTYLDGTCEPYYFNHAWESSPATLFYDGHVETIGTRNAMRADGRMRVQTDDPDWGLWSKDVPRWGEDGYLSDYAYDQAATSYHILTTDGIRGRDILAD